MCSPTGWSPVLRPAQRLSLLLYLVWLGDCISAGSSPPNPTPLTRPTRLLKLLVTRGVTGLLLGLVGTACANKKKHNFASCKLEQNRQGACNVTSVTVAVTVTMTVPVICSDDCATTTILRTVILVVTADCASITTATTMPL